MESKMLRAYGMPEGWQVFETLTAELLRRDLYSPHGYCILRYRENATGSPEDIDASAKWAVLNTNKLPMGINLQTVIELYQTVVASLRTGGMKHPFRYSIGDSLWTTTSVTFGVEGYTIQLWVHSSDERTLVATGNFPKVRLDSEALTEVEDRLYLVVRQSPDFEIIPLHFAKRWLSHAQPIKKMYRIYADVELESEDSAWDWFDDFVSSETEAKNYFTIKEI